MLVRNKTCLNNIINELVLTKNTLFGECNANFNKR